MFREYEIAFWASLNTEDDINKIKQEYASESNAESTIIQAIRSRITMTAFYTKQKISGEKTEKAVQAFFSNHFDYFIGKHTDWLLLNEPEINITPMVINKTTKDLTNIYHKHIAKKESTLDNDQLDLNHVVAMISEEKHDGIKAKRVVKRKEKPEGEYTQSKRMRMNDEQIL